MGRRYKNRKHKGQESSSSRGAFERGPDCHGLLIYRVRSTIKPSMTCITQQTCVVWHRGQR